MMIILGSFWLVIWQSLSQLEPDLKIHLKHTASVCDIMEKSKYISKKIRKRVVDVENLYTSNINTPWDRPARIPLRIQMGSVIQQSMCFAANSAY